MELKEFEIYTVESEYDNHNHKKVFIFNKIENAPYVRCHATLGINNYTDGCIHTTFTEYSVCNISGNISLLDEEIRLATEMEKHLILKELNSFLNCDTFFKYRKKIEKLRNGE